MQTKPSLLVQKFKVLLFHSLSALLLQVSALSVQHHYSLSNPPSPIMSSLQALQSLLWSLLAPSNHFHISISSPRFHQQSTASYYLHFQYNDYFIDQWIQSSPTYSLQAPLIQFCSRKCVWRAILVRLAIRFNRLVSLCAFREISNLCMHGLFSISTMQEYLLIT